jgi:uncharacterized protein (UPF0212 family)
MKFRCPKCGEWYEGALHSENQTADGTRVRVFDAKCEKHGGFARQVHDRPFLYIRVNVRLTERDTVSCPRCCAESSASVTYESQEFDGSKVRLIDADCPTHGFFKGIEQVP